MVSAGLRGGVRVGRAGLGLVLVLAGIAACSAPADEPESSQSSKIQHNGSQYFLTEYEGINPDDHGYTDVVPPTVAGWKAKYMPPGTPVVTAFYRNARDLGFWREMSCTKRFVRGGVGGCAVTTSTGPTSRRSASRTSAR
jgi:hypothetical protein